MKKIGFAIFLFVLTIVFTKSASASLAGEFELRSTDSNEYYCFAYTQPLQNHVYKVLITCENIVFPVDDTIFTYVLWANTEDGGTPIRLGSIGLGVAEFSTKSRFTSLFITTEENAAAKVPSGEVVMKGSIKPIQFLERGGEGESEEVSTDENETSPSPTPTAQKSSIRDRLLTGLKRAGLASGLALVAILGLVFILTRPR